MGMVTKRTGLIKSMENMLDYVTIVAEVRRFSFDFFFFLFVCVVCICTLAQYDEVMVRKLSRRAYNVFVGWLFSFRSIWLILPEC